MHTCNYEKTTNVKYRLRNRTYGVDRTIFMSEQFFGKDTFQRVRPMFRWYCVIIYLIFLQGFTNFLFDNHRTTTTYSIFTKFSQSRIQQSQNNYI